MKALEAIRVALKESASASQDQRAALALNLYKLLKEAESANLSLLEKAQLAGLRKKAEAFIACVKQEYDEKYAQLLELMVEPPYEDGSVYNQEKFERNLKAFQMFISRLEAFLGSGFKEILLNTDPFSDDTRVYTLAEVMEANPRHGWYQPDPYVNRPFAAKVWEINFPKGFKERMARGLLNKFGWPRELAEI